MPRPIDRLRKAKEASRRRSPISANLAQAMAYINMTEQALHPTFATDPVFSLLLAVLNWIKLVV